MSQLAGGLYDHVATLLDAMGDEPGTVAATLRIEDVRGVRGSVVAHPVCRWLARLVPDLGAVLGRDAVHVFRPGRGQGMHGAVVPLPPAVQAFADRYDDGEHPELELCLLPPVALTGQTEQYSAGLVDRPAIGPRPAPEPPPLDPVTDTVPLTAIR